MNLGLMISVLKLATFVWAIFEVGVLTHLYFFAHKQAPHSKIMRAVFWFLVISTVSLINRFLVTYAAYLGGLGTHKFLRDVGFFITAGMALSARILRIASKTQEEI